MPFLLPTREKHLSLLECKKNQINFLKEEVSFQKIEHQLQDPIVQSKIKSLETKIQYGVCAKIPITF